MLYSKDNIMDLSIILPCYNENKNIEGIINQLIDLNFKNIKYEIIFVDNGSTDNSFKNLRILKKKFNSGIIKLVKIEENLGYGNGIIYGLTKCKGEFIGWTHADLQTDPIDVLNGFKKIYNKKDFIKGKRRGRSFFDVFFSIGMSLETTEEELIKTIYPHPTLSEMIPESVLNAFGREIHI